VAKTCLVEAAERLEALHGQHAEMGSMLVELVNNHERCEYIAHRARKLLQEAGCELS
jgi:hypothetical protein